MDYMWGKAYGKGIRKMMGVGRGDNQGLLEMSPTFELYLSSSTRQTL